MNDFNENKGFIAPVTLGEWMITMLIMVIPVVNIVMLFVWAFGDGTNPSKSNWAKAQLIWMLIFVVLYALVAVLFLGTIMSGLGSGY
jgi:heme/copper-type cytochrome/quinol oxidase subunit 2